MAQFFQMHPVTPQLRLLRQTAAILEQDGVIVYPTDTNYGLGCSIFSRKGVERIIKIKQLSPNHQFSILCPDLADISQYARVDNGTYRLLKRYLPGPYTFILEATREVPKTLLPKRKTIGLRIPDHPICLALLREFGKPLLSTSMELPDREGVIISDPREMRERLDKVVDLLIDGGPTRDRYSTLVDLTGDAPRVLREGAGDPTPFA
ncbi:MAG: threonylcarbamoyl-AMP synthase [Magnetococcales bacterium]|nr:threonylcarbamoyl-AMP synthase [Magnetococcales bacterium]